MTDGVGTAKTGTAAIGHRPSVYQGEAVHEVRARARTVNQETSPEERDGLIRLRQIMRRGVLRDDVPRGYHLNIKV